MATQILTTITSDEVDAIITYHLHPLYLAARRVGPMGPEAASFGAAFDMLVEVLVRTGWHPGGEAKRHALATWITTRLDNLPSTASAGMAK